MENDVLLHAMDRLAHAKVKDSLYPYFYIEKIFPDAFYEELIDNLPDTASFQGLSQNRKG